MNSLFNCDYLSLQRNFLHRAMLFSEVLGQEHIKNHLSTTANNGRVPHAQIFSGKGVLPIALAYAQYILCGDCEIENQSAEMAACNAKFQKLNHPDLHFAYPVATNDRVKSKPLADDFAEEWRNSVIENPYMSLHDWYAAIGIEKKQGQIGVEEAQSIVKKLSLKSYEGGYKVMLIWMAEKMNTACANKLLKLLEEPPEKTVFLLLVEDEEQLLTTISSRCQLLKLPLLSEEVIANALVARENTDFATAKSCARQAAGDYNAALQLLRNKSEDSAHEKLIVFWLRAAFRAKGNKAVISDLIQWSDDLSTKNREEQKNFLSYCLHFFRQALLLNYNTLQLVYIQPKEPKFSLEKFAPFVHGGNILAITEALEEASYHIERNGNAKIIFTDLSIKLTRFLHQTQ
jgi:DNA polymerase-3 subunit delta'